MTESNLSDLFTYASPVVIILLVMFCLFRFFVRWSGCKKHCLRQVSSTVPVDPDMVVASRHNPTSLPVVPFEITEFDGQTFYTVPFILERFPPKYEDAIKMPSTTPRRASVTGTIPPPPFYENAQASTLDDAPPAYWTLPRLGTSQALRANGPSSSNLDSVYATPMVACSSNDEMFQVDEQKLQRGQTPLVRHAPLTQSLSDSVRLDTVRPLTNQRTSLNMVRRTSTIPATVMTHIPPLPGAVLEMNSEESPQELRVEELEKG